MTTVKEGFTEEGEQIFPNDAFQADAPCLENFLDGILFWSKHTPSSTALFFPRMPGSHSMETVQWNELRVCYIKLYRYDSFADLLIEIFQI